jgi:hypothetical protein
MRTMNKAEQKAVYSLYSRMGARPSYLNFRRLVYYNNMMGCWMLYWKGMWIGIEKDGYTHS